jgi:hypothetical protein
MSQCDTCAFGHTGSQGAADESSNRLKGLIAARSLVPFYCHHRRDGTEWEWRSSLSSVEFLKLAPGDRKVCDGWKAEVRRLTALGKFNIASTPADNSALRRYQRQLGDDCIRALDAYLAEKDSPAEKAELKAHFESLVRAVFEIPEGEWERRGHTC